MKKNQLLVAFFCVLLIPAIGQVPTDGDYRSRATGNWGAAATWEVRSGGNWAVASVIPTAANTVYIQQGHTVTVNIAAAVCNDLQVNFTSGVLSIGANILSVNGKLRQYTGTPVTGAGTDGVFYSSQADNSSNSATIITSTSGYLRFVGNSRAIVTSNLVWGGGTTGLAVDFALNPGQTGTLASTFKAKEFIFSSGTISTTLRIAPDNGSANSGTVTIKNGATLISSRTGTASGSQVFSRTGAARCLQVTIESGGTLELTGADPRMDVTSFVNDGSVVYNRSGIQNLLQASGNDAGLTTKYTNYFNLTIRTSGNKTIPSGYAVTIAPGGSFTVNGDATCVLAGTGSLSYGAGATFICSSTAIVTLPGTSLEWPSAGGPDNVTVNSSTLAFTPNPSAYQVQSYSLIGNIATINTAAPHGFSAGQTVTVTNIYPCDTLFDGTYTLLSASGNTITYAMASPYTIPLESATAPFGAVTINPLVRKIPGTLRLNGGALNIGAGNKLVMGNGSTIVRSSTDINSKLITGSGFVAFGEASGELVNILINANGQVEGSAEMSNNPSPGGFGTLTITSTAKYRVIGGRQVINLVNDGDFILNPNTGLIITIYGTISGSGVITSGNSNASLTIGATGIPSAGINSGYAGILRFNQSIPGITNAFKNFKIERIPAPAGTPTVTIANNVSFKGTYNQSNGIVELASGATFTLTGYTGNSGAFLRGNSNAGIEVTGTGGAAGNLYIDQTTPGITNLFKDFTLDRPGGSVNLKNSTVIGSNLTLTNGSLNIDNNNVNFEIAGNFSNNSGSGTIGGGADNNTSILPNLILSGSGTTFNPLKFTAGFTEFRNVTVSRSVSVDGTAGNGLRIQGTITLTGASTTLSTNDNVTLRSTIAGSSRVAGVAGISTPFSGSFTVERYVPANANRAWRLLSIPTLTNQTINASLQNGQPTGVQGPAGVGTWVTSKLSNAVANGYDAQSPNNHTLLKYNSTTNAWEGVTTPTNTTPIATDGGYMLFVRGDRTANNLFSTITPTTLSTKGPLKTGNYPAVPISINADQYQVAGNPYVSAIDLRNVVRTGGTDAIFYVWDPKILPLGAFQTLTFNGSNYVITPGGGNYGPSGSVMDTIQSGQAFMAHATGTAGTLQFTEACKITGSRSVFRPVSGNSLPQTLITNLYTVNSDQSSDISDGTMTVYGEEFNAGVDELDAKKLVNFGENLSMIRYGQHLAVEKTAVIGITDTVFYQLTKLRVKKYRLQIIATHLAHPNLLGKLEDKYTGNSIPVNLNGITEYEFSPAADAPGSYAPDRFRLVYYQSGVMPVNQLSLQATQVGRMAGLEWKVENQINIRRYEVERSRNGSLFETLHHADAKGGNGETVRYGWLDEHAYRGDLYYRVKQISKSGEVTYSNTAKVQLGRSEKGVAVFPNLISGKEIQIQFTNQEKGIYRLILINSTGQQVLNRQISHPGGSGVQILTAGATRANGSCQLQIIHPDNRKTTQPLVFID